MASDVLHVLDSAEIEAAHLLGISLGGMIAQDFAINHPSRVRGLVRGALRGQICVVCGRAPEASPRPPPPRGPRRFFIFFVSTYIISDNILLPQLGHDQCPRLIAG